MTRQSTIPIGVVVLVLAALIITQRSAHSGDGYVVGKGTVDGGGRSVVGGDYRASGTVVQHDTAEVSGASIG